MSFLSILDFALVDPGDLWNEVSKGGSDRSSDGIPSLVCNSHTICAMVCNEASCASHHIVVSLNIHLVL